MSLQSEIESIVAQPGTAVVGVGFHDLNSNQSFSIAPHRSFHAASTMKLCVLFELFHQVELKDISLDEPILIHNSFPSIVDGVLFGIGQEDDSEQTLYDRIGEFELAVSLATPMITQSSNLATNLLVDRLKADRITQFMADLGAPGLVVRRGVEDTKAYRQGLNNTVTALGLTKILQALASSSVLSPMACQSMIEILSNQTHRNCIPAGVPRTVPIANKPGWNDGICHDCGIVFPPGRLPYVLTVLTEGLADKVAGEQLISLVSRRVFESVVG